VPYILRPKDDGAYKLVKETYVHGFIKDEAFKNKAAKDSIKEIKLV
jgi:hypothetical protein